MTTVTTSKPIINLAGVSKSFGWPWFNARMGMQYTYYNKLNGTTVAAQDNNTLFLHAWVAF